MNNSTSSTPAVANGLVFATDCGGTLHCVDANTGKGCWTHAMKGRTWGSPAGGRRQGLRSHDERALVCSGGDEGEEGAGLG